MKLTGIHYIDVFLPFRLGMCDQTASSVDKMSKSNRLVRLKIMDSPAGSADVSPVPGVLSPMTDLAVNLGGLSTSGVVAERFYRASNHIRIYSPQLDTTPKRRISWSGIDTPIRKLTDGHGIRDEGELYASSLTLVLCSCHTCIHMSHVLWVLVLRRHRLQDYRSTEAPPPHQLFPFGLISYQLFHTLQSLEGVLSRRFDAKLTNYG